MDRALEEFRTRKCPESSDLPEGSLTVPAADEGRVRLKATRKGTQSSPIKTYGTG